MNNYLRNIFIGIFLFLGYWIVGSLSVENNVYAVDTVISLHFNNGGNASSSWVDWSVYDGDDNLTIASSGSENIIIDSADDIIFDADGQCKQIGLTSNRNSNYSHAKH